MKKLFIPFLVVIIAALGVGGYYLYNYYQDTYVGDTYYTQIPETKPELVTIKDQDGKALGKGYEYTTTGYSESGTKKSLYYYVITEGEYRDGDAYTPGSTYKVVASKNRIISMQAISPGEIPDTIHFD